MRKLSTMFIVMAFMLCISLFGCGGSSSSSSGSYETAFVGTWNAVEMTGDESYDKDQVEALRTLGMLDIYMNLEEDGKAIFSSVSGNQSSSVEGIWKAESETQATFTVNENSTPMTLEDGQLSMTSNDTTMIFEKVDHRDPIPASSTDASSANASASSSDASASTAAQESAVSQESSASQESAESQESTSAAAAVPVAGAESQGAASSSTSDQSSSEATYEASIDAVEVGADYEGNPALIVTFSWKNNSEETTSFATKLYAKCFQNGVQLDTAFVYENIDNNGYMADVRPGYGTTFQMAYELKDTENPVEIEIENLFDFNGKPILTKTFEL